MLKMPKHPLTKEKELLKGMAKEMTDLKLRLKGPHLKRLYTTQQRLARQKARYRNYFLAYCLARQSMSGKFTSVLAINTKAKVNWTLVKLRHIKLLSDICKFQTTRMNLMHGIIDELEPCIAIFTSNSGITKRLRIKDFERRPNGDFCWSVGESGTVTNEIHNWPVRDNDCVWMTKNEHDRLPPDQQYEDKENYSFDI